MKYKTHEKYEGREFWSSSPAPEGYRRARTCENCAKCAMVSSAPPASFVCNEVTEYTGVWDTGVPRGYSRQPFYTAPNSTCDVHKFEWEMEEAEA